MKLRTFTVINKHPSSKMTINKIEAFTRIYKADMVVFDEGDVVMRRMSPNPHHLIPAKKYNNILHMLEHWEILDRRVLIEKIGNII